MTSGPADDDDVTQALARIASDVGGTLHVWPRPGRAVSRVILRDRSDDLGSQFETAQIEDDGTLRITGHDRGAAVSKAFGDDITSYEWVYVVAPDRVAALVGLLGGQEGDDPLATLAAYHQRTGGAISDKLKHPDAAAELSTWIT